MRRSEGLVVVVPHERSALEVFRGRGPVAEFVSSALGLDANALERALVRMRRRHPGETDIQLARRCVTNAAWSAGGVSLLLGLPDHPALAILAAAVEALVVRRIRLVASAKIALLQEAEMLRAGRDPIAALRAVAGRHAAAHAAAALCATTGKKARKTALRRVAKVDATQVVGALCKGVGLAACSGTILKVVPVVGAVAGAASSARAMRREMERAFPSLKAARPLPETGAVLASSERKRSSSGVARRAAVEIVGAGIRTADVLAAATRRACAQFSTLQAEARARARAGGIAIACVAAA